MSLVPIVVEKTANGERSYDLFSRLMNDRIIMLTGEVNDAAASVICAQLLYLESADPDKDIHFYINSPGGSITAGMAILDTMRFIKCDVSTICMGMAASMGSLLLAAGTKGKRFCLPNSEVMIHQPLGGASGQATDVSIHAEHLLKTKKKINEMLAKMTGQNIDTISKDTERDNFMTAEDALNYGLIDRIITERN